MTNVQHYTTDRLFSVDVLAEFASRTTHIDAQGLVAGGRFGDLGSCRKVLAELGLPEGMPFLIDEHSRPVRSINQWLKSLPMRGSRSRNTWDAYAGDAAAWHRHCASHGVHVLDATADHLDAYHAIRRLGALGEDQLVDPATWNRWVAAVDNFYRWANSQGLTSANPFTYETVTVLDSRHGVIQKVKNQAYESRGRAHSRLYWLEESSLSFFINVGICGLLPDGSPDPTFRGRHVPRNRALARGMSSGGYRHREILHLLEADLPALPERRVSHVFVPVSAAVTKGGIARQTLMDVSALREIRDYLRHERLDAAIGSWKHGRPSLLQDLGPETGRVDGTIVRRDLMDRHLRRRLVDEAGASPLAFLSGQGAPLLGVSHVFAAATARCRRFDPRFPNVTPHTMRHTFAVHMFEWLVRMAQAHAERHAHEFGFGIWAQYFRSTDPLIALQRMLGHASVTTTEMYLRGLNPKNVYLNLLADAEDNDEA